MRPIFVRVAYPDNEHVAVGFDPVDAKMGLEGMDTHRWRQFKPLSRHSGSGSDQVKDREQLVMILSGLHSAEQAYPLLGIPTMSSSAAKERRNPIIRCRVTFQRV